MPPLVGIFSPAAGLPQAMNSLFGHQVPSFFPSQVVGGISWVQDNRPGREKGSDFPSCSGLCPLSRKSVRLCMPLGRFPCKLKLLVQDGRYNLRWPNQNESQGFCLECQGKGTFFPVSEGMNPDEKAGTEAAMKELA